MKSNLQKLWNHAAGFLPTITACGATVDWELRPACYRCGRAGSHAHANSGSRLRSGNRADRLGLAVIAVCLLGVVPPAHAQRKVKGPKPPSYEEVWRRALEQKRLATNAPAAVEARPKVQATPAPPPEAPALTHPAAATTSVDTLLKEAKAGQARPAPQPAPPQIVPKPTPITVSAPAIAAPSTPAKPLPESPATTPPQAVRPTPGVEPPPWPERVTPPAKTAKPPRKSKGPVFSPLPPDLAPTNEAPRRASRGAAASNVATSLVATLEDQHVLAIGNRLSFRILADEDEPRL